MPTIQWDAQVLAGSALLYWFQQGHRGRQGMQCLSPAQFPTWKLQNASTNRYPVICWILDLPFPWSFPTLLPHITYKKFRSQPLLQFSSVPGVIFNACQGVIEARMSLLPSNSAWRISITNSTQSSSLAVIQVIHLVQRVRQRLKKKCCNYCAIKAQWFNFISLWHKICICNSHLLCREYDSTKTRGWDLIYKVVQKV